MLIAFPFITQRQTERKRRPALVVQADRYHRRRAAVVIAAITSMTSKRLLPCKVPVTLHSPEGRQTGLRLDSVIDCQTIATVPREEIVARLGTLPPELMRKVDSAVMDALGLATAAATSG